MLGPGKPQTSLPQLPSFPGDVGSVVLSDRYTRERLIGAYILAALFGVVALIATGAFIVTHRQLRALAEAQKAVARSAAAGKRKKKKQLGGLVSTEVYIYYGSCCFLSYPLFVLAFDFYSFGVMLQHRLLIVYGVCLVLL